MKFNWGTGIVITFILFIGFILFFVISMSTNKKYKYDLVTEKYYQKELSFQGEIDAEKNGKKLEEDIKIERTNKGLEIHFPKNFEPEKITGKIFLYRPSNKQLDFEIPISLSDSYLLVPEKNLLDGRWNMAVNWSYNNKDYLFKKEITY